MTQQKERIVDELKRANNFSISEEKLLTLSEIRTIIEQV